jgi:hypothetical protein
MLLARRNPPSGQNPHCGDHFIIYIRESASSKLRGKEAKQPTLAAGGPGRREDRANN